MIVKGEKIGKYTVGSKSPLVKPQIKLTFLKFKINNKKNDTA